MLSPSLPWTLANPKWAAELNQIIANPLSSVVFLNGVVLASGANTINHSLGRTPQGWFLTDTNGTATVYRSQPFNSTTLTLTASSGVTVNIGVF